MTFPTVPTAGANTLLQDNEPTAVTTHTFPSLTTLDNAAGDLLLAIIVCYQGGSADAEFSAWGGGFTEFADRATNSTTVQSIGAAYKFSDGTETGTFTVATVATTRSAMFLLSIKGAHDSTPPEAGLRATGTTAAADIIGRTASWGAEDNLWIAVGVNGETSLTGSFTGITAAPTNYTTGFAESGIVGGDVIGALEGALGFRQLNAASDDPATFTLDVGAAGNASMLIVARPAGVADWRPIQQPIVAPSTAALGSAW